MAVWTWKLVGIFVRSKYNIWLTLKAIRLDRLAVEIQCDHEKNVENGVFYGFPAEENYCKHLAKECLQRTVWIKRWRHNNFHCTLVTVSAHEQWLHSQISPKMSWNYLLISDFGYVVCNSTATYPKSCFCRHINTVRNMDKCYKLLQTVISVRTATTVGGIDTGDCSESDEAYHRQVLV